MLKPIFSKVMWIGKVTTFVVGLAVVLALTLAIVATAAEAAKVKSVKLGIQNTVSAVTTIAGTLAGPILSLDNNGTGPALDLQVESGNAPLTVNPEAGTATGLSADELDGKDISEFPATVVQTVNITGQGATVPFGAATFVAPPSR